MKYLIILMLMVSCGPQEIKVKTDPLKSEKIKAEPVSGKVDIVIKLDPTILTLIEDKCTNNYETIEEIDLCKEERVQEILDIITKISESYNDNKVQ